MELVNESNDPRFAISFSPRKEGFRYGLKKKLHQAKEGMLHDTMKIGGGVSPFKVWMWKLMGKLFPPHHPLYKSNRALTPVIIEQNTFQSYPGMSWSMANGSSAVSLSIKDRHATFLGARPFINLL